ncbi:MAG: hypothetical protein ACKVPX_12650 [Myxococcaceae bacterium]
MARRIDPNGPPTLVVTHLPTGAAFTLPAEKANRDVIRVSKRSERLLDAVAKRSKRIARNLLAKRIPGTLIDRWMGSGKAPTADASVAEPTAADRELALERQLDRLRLQVASLEEKLKHAQAGRERDDAQRRRVGQLDSEVGRLSKRATALQGSLDRVGEQRRRLDRQVVTLTAEVALHRGLQTRLDTTLADLAAARVQAETLARQVDELRGHIETLEAKRVDRGGVAKTALSGAPELVESISAMARGKGAVLDHLRVATRLSADRVFVLDEAWRSAEVARDFRYPEKVGDLIHRLLNDYFDVVAGGKGDAEARKVFGSAFAATESDAVQGSKWMMRHRTFRYDGREIKALAHLKIGNTDSPHETLRIYFEWDAKTRKIVICWCGEHPPNTKT